MSPNAGPSMLPIVIMMIIVIAAGLIAYGIYALMRSWLLDPNITVWHCVSSYWLWTMPLPYYPMALHQPQPDYPDDYFDSYPDDL